MPNIFSKPVYLDIAVNRCFGGFSLSEKAVEELCKRIGDPKIESYSFQCYSEIYPRHHPDLIKVIKELGDEADGQFAQIDIDYIEEIYKEHYSISEYDGMERIVIDYQRYTNDQIKNILYSEEDDSTKVLKMKEILK
jgi:hypothetical protein